MANNSISAHDLTYRYDGFTAVDHISFDVAEGEVFVFWGRTAPARPPRYAC
jgi:ABC-type multidrug transport system ATPase subunit